MKILIDLEKLKNRYNKRIEVLEERKMYAEGKQFDKILDEISDLVESIDTIEKAAEWIKAEQSGEFNIIKWRKGERCNL